jgi:hypothetical protein
MGSRLVACVAVLTLALSTGLSTTVDAAGHRFLTLPFKSTKGMHIQRAWGVFDGVQHHGIDYIHGIPGDPSSWKGFPVLAAAPGVACAQRAGKHGCIELPDEKLTDRVLIRHRVDGRTYYTFYQHVTFIDSRIPIGAGGRTVHVKRGQRIGRTGPDEGAASLIHLHFELLDANLQPIDPYQIYKKSGAYPDPAGRNRLRAKPGHYWIDNPPQPPERSRPRQASATPSPSIAAVPSVAPPSSAVASPAPSGAPASPGACGPPEASPVPSASIAPAPSTATVASPAIAPSTSSSHAPSCAPGVSASPVTSPVAPIGASPSPAATGPPG